MSPIGDNSKKHKIFNLECLRQNVLNLDGNFFNELTHLISTIKYTNTFAISRPIGAQIQIENFKQSLFPFFARALLYYFNIFVVRSLALTYKNVKIRSGTKGSN